MDYEKKYKEALERAKNLRKDAIDMEENLRAKQCEIIFPELAVSEDERIRKRIYNYINVTLDDNESVEKEKWLAWLEKQGEIDKASYEIAEKEKREFVGDGFIKCYAYFQDFKEGETYWLEYLGNDNYNVRSDNLLGKTYHITPCQLYTIFKKQNWLERQGETFTKKDVDDAYLKGVCDAKHELEKQRVEEAMRYIEEKSKAYMEAHKWESVDKFMAMCRGEQKPIDKVEPKFKVGDWVVNKGHSYLIADIDYLDNRYLFEIGGYTHEQLNWEHIENADNKYHLWTIQDAKDGDVLVYGDNPNDYHVEVIMIFKSLRNKHSAFTHFHIFDDEFRINDWCDCGENAHPATKEQRDALMKAMADAGYTFDFEKKELKNIEKKSDWSVEDEYTLKDIIEEIEANKSNAPDYDLATYDRFLNWLNSLKKRITNN